MDTCGKDTTIAAEKGNIRGAYEKSMIANAEFLHLLGQEGNLNPLDFFGTMVDIGVTTLAANVNHIGF